MTHGQIHSVLVVDDDPDLREALSDVLIEHGYLVTTAENGLDALQRLRGVERPPCLILLDLMMPTMDGWQFRDEQQRDTRLASIPVVAFSARSDTRPVDGAEWLRKPIALERLLEVVARHCHCVH